MDTLTKCWLAMRALRWLSWIGFLLYALHYYLWPEMHNNQFGHLYPSTEAWMFGLGLMTAFTGMFELALRGRAGLAPPKPFRLMAVKATGPITPIR